VAASWWIVGPARTITAGVLVAGLDEDAVLVYMVSALVSLAARSRTFRQEKIPPSQFRMAFTPFSCASPYSFDQYDPIFLMILKQEK
jgi:hypothetical protein